MSRRNVFVIWQDIYHPKEYYTDVLSQVFSPDEWTVEYTEDPRDLTNLQDLPDLAMRITGHRNDDMTPTPAQHEAFEGMVQSGMGIIYWHAGLAYVRPDTAERTVAGGVFIVHPPAGEPVYITPLPGVSHPILEGIKPFEAVDEHYFCQVDIERVQPFLISRTSAGTELAGWTHTLGQGRVCTITPGHDTRMVSHMTRLIKNAALWCTYQI